MQPLFILVGPPAAGKSTTSKALASKFSQSIHIPVDDIRDMVVAGLVLPGLEWSPELVRQISLARESAIHIARSYQSAGFAAVIDDFIDPNQLSEYQAFQNMPGIHKFVLYPNQAAAHMRNSRRAGSDPARDYIEEGIRIVYQQLDHMIEPLRKNGWIIIDTTELSIEETVLQILKHSSASRSSHPTGGIVG
ncbi:MAG: ATP-binding protein [Anaerolineales bacterium]|jgi:regulator of PEP synthase PpsR (kinase-PPPase family)|nr:ATP-binding protein [Anaerolineales bacterium]